MPANIDAPGMRLQVKPHPRWDARAYDHAAWLAPPTDSWVIAGLRDSSGQSGEAIQLIGASATGCGCVKTVSFL